MATNTSYSQRHTLGFLRCSPSKLQRAIKGTEKNRDQMSDLSTITHNLFSSQQHGHQAVMG